MNRKASRFLAYPYIIWMAGFTVIPLLMVFYYGLTDRSGAFTLANILAIGSSEHLKGALALSNACWCQYRYLSRSGISAGADLKKAPYRKRQLCGVHLHPPDVDELSA